MMPQAGHITVNAMSNSVITEDKKDRLTGNIVSNEIKNKQQLEKFINKNNLYNIATPQGSLDDNSNYVLDGTPGYTPPEGNTRNTSTDVYSTSLVMLELLCPRFSTLMERMRVMEDFRR